MENPPTMSRPPIQNQNMQGMQNFPRNVAQNVSAAPPQVAVRADQMEYQNNQDNPVCCATRGGPNFSHVLLLRITGGLCVLFGVIEVGLGASLYTFFSNFRAGAWWSVVLVILSGCGAACAVTRQRLFITCIIASVGIVISLIGSFQDGGSAAVFKSLSACGSQSNANTAATTYYGKQSTYDNVDDCLVIAKTDNLFYYNTCYCTDDNGLFCGSFKLSPSSLAAGRTCSNILTNYTPTLSASAAFCVLSLFSIFGLSVLSCCVLCCPQKLPAGGAGGAGGADGGGLRRAEATAVQARTDVVIVDTVYDVNGQCINDRNIQMSSNNGQMSCDNIQMSSNNGLMSNNNGQMSNNNGQMSDVNQYNMQNNLNYGPNSGQMGPNNGNMYTQAIIT